MTGTRLRDERGRYTFGSVCQEEPPMSATRFRAALAVLAVLVVTAVWTISRGAAPVQVEAREVRVTDPTPPVTHPAPPPTVVTTTTVDPLDEMVFLVAWYQAGTTTTTTTTTTRWVPPTTRMTPTTTPRTTPPTTQAPPDTEAPEPQQEAPEPAPSYTGGGLPPFLVCVRQRESRGNYQINTGNGYYGAFQFSMSTWANTARHAGRGDLAGVLPSSASPADQDAMAIHLYGWQGRSPWAGPGC